MEEQCIFCFDTEDVFKLHGVCDCRPNVDMTCIKKWYEMKPDTCPICLETYIDIEPDLEAIEAIEARRRLNRIDNMWYKIYVFAKFSSVISFCILVFILAIYLLDKHH